MRHLSLDQLDAAATRFDAAVLVSDGVDAFCSSSDWAIPAARGLLPGREPWICESDHGFVALMRAKHDTDVIYEPLEAMWGLGCPIVGSDSAALAHDFAAELGSTGEQLPLVLCGLEHGSQRVQSVVGALRENYSLLQGTTTRRCVASLDGGLDGFLGRRSSHFRRGLKRAQRRAAERGMSWTGVAPGASATQIYDRVLAVERFSWKSASGNGLLDSTMVEFYRWMVPRLVSRGALRLLFAQHEGRDVAYILGGLLAGTYRGLQFSYSSEYEDCSLGNLCQLEMITRLCAEGVTLYDLGTDGDYKRRWAEITRDTVTVIAVPRGERLTRVG